MNLVEAVHEMFRSLRDGLADKPKAKRRTKKKTTRKKKAR